eukprot:GHVL01013203.1.p1 GENE.GHVL01013203.1~~GHVL01013203.1.p1  ORF type:complete len:582 (-),score=135.65 GHVL01013203.1:69-1814(-)
MTNNVLLERTESNTEQQLLKRTPLNKEDKTLIKDLLRGDENQIIFDCQDFVASHQEPGLSRKTLLCLEEDCWLNNHVIDLFLSLKQLHERDTLFYSCGFWTKLCAVSNKGEFDKKEFERWDSAYFWTIPLSQRRKLKNDLYKTRKCKMRPLHHDFVVFPMHSTEEMHWTLGVLDWNNKKFEFLDSLQDPPPTPKIVQLNTAAVEKWIKFEQEKEESLCGVTEKTISKKILNRIKLQINVSYRKDIPFQSNDNDCGVFVCFLSEKVNRNSSEVIDISIAKSLRGQILLLFKNKLPTNEDVEMTYLDDKKDIKKTLKNISKTKEDNKLVKYTNKSKNVDKKDGANGSKNIDMSNDDVNNSISENNIHTAIDIDSKENNIHTDIDIDSKDNNIHTDIDPDSKENNYSNKNTEKSEIKINNLNRGDERMEESICISEEYDKNDTKSEHFSQKSKRTNKCKKNKKKRNSVTEPQQNNMDIDEEQDADAEVKNVKKINNCKGNKSEILHSSEEQASPVNSHKKIEKMSTDTTSVEKVSELGENSPENKEIVVDDNNQFTPIKNETFSGFPNKKMYGKTRHQLNSLVV